MSDIDVCVDGFLELVYRIERSDLDGLTNFFADNADVLWHRIVSFFRPSHRPRHLQSPRQSAWTCPLRANHPRPCGWTWQA